MEATRRWVELIKSILVVMGGIASLGLVLLFVFGMPGPRWEPRPLSELPGSSEGIGTLSLDGTVPDGRPVRVTFRAATAYQPTGLNTSSGGLVFSEIAFADEKIALDGQLSPFGLQNCERGSLLVKVDAPAVYQPFRLRLVCTFAPIEDGVLSLFAKASNLGSGERLNGPIVTIDVATERNLIDRVFDITQ